MHTYAGASYVILLRVDAYYYAHIEVASCSQADRSKRKSVRMLHASDHITINCKSAAKTQVYQQREHNDICHPFLANICLMKVCTIPIPITAGYALTGVHTMLQDTFDVLFSGAMKGDSCCVWLDKGCGQATRSLKEAVTDGPPGLQQMRVPSHGCTSLCLQKTRKLIQVGLDQVNEFVSGHFHSRKDWPRLALKTRL